MTPELLRSKLARLPEDPGVYIFRDRSGTILYIGKAKSLKSRVRTYFQKTEASDPKVQYLRGEAADLDYVVTDNEVEALILESTLVKREQPYLNVRLKDDKAFLHIKLTVNEPFPRVLLTRRVQNDGALYFGPYLPASLARNTIKIINRHFLLRSCDIEIDGKLERPCLEYYIDRCLGPCVEGLCDRETYRQAVRDVILLLEGKNDELLERLTEKMQRASDVQNYEAAAFFRDRVRLVKELAERQKMAASNTDDVDVFAYYREGRRVALQLFTLRDGRVIGKKEFYWEDLDFFQPPAFLKDALQQYYLNARSIPRFIYLPCAVEDQDLIAEWLNQCKTGRARLQLVIPKRGKKYDLLLLVERNARIAFENRFKVIKSNKEALLKTLQKDLDLARAPERIEAFDISNIQGADSVASMVVCRGGVMDRKSYRKFKIKSVEGADDFASIREAVQRRYRRVVEQHQALPDLVLIDGGKGQLHSAYQALSELGLEELPLAAIAKREELVFVKGQEEPIALDDISPALHLLQEIRDEAHRFAVTYHRKRRSMRDFSSALDDIPGIGQKRKKRLLQNFGSVTRIEQASVEELTPFLGEKLARVVKERLTVRS